MAKKKLTKKQIDGRKKPRQGATAKQRRAFELLPKHNYNTYQAMREAGYTHYTSKMAGSRLLDRKGFKFLCEEAGLSDDFVVKCLKEDIASKKGNRGRELELAFKAKGLLTEHVQVEGINIEIQDTLKGLKDIVENETDKEDNKKAV